MVIYLDKINLMTFDLHDLPEDSKKTSHSSALYPAAEDVGTKKFLNVLSNVFMYIIIKLLFLISSYY